MSSLEDISGDVEEALEAISVPSYVVDASKVCYVKIETSVGRVGF